MSELLNLLHGALSVSCLSFSSNPSNSLRLLQHNSFLFNGDCAAFRKNQGKQCLLQGTWGVVYHVRRCSIPCKAKVCDGADLNDFPHVQTLRKFPKEEIFTKIVMVRFDSAVLLREELDQQSPPVTSALSTIRYLYNAGATVILVSSWSAKINSRFSRTESVAEFLSSVLQLKVVPAKFLSGNLLSKMEDVDKSNIFLLENLSQFKGEIANCSNFAEQLSSGVDMFVNDAFSQSHKVLASTVGVTRFCCACVAGFHYEEGLCQLQKVIKTKKRPYVAIVGGGNLLEKASALQFLASKCDGLVFVGVMAFQIMFALGLPVPMKLVDPGAYDEALYLTQLAKLRSIPILYPKDLWCINGCLSKQLEIFPSDRILDGWQPVDLGPKSLDEISSLLLKCQKIIWIGPVKFSFSSSSQNISGASKLALILDKLSQSHCDISVIGNMACKTLKKESHSVSIYNMVENASVVWEFLKRRKLPGLLALDRAYPFEIDWHATYTDPTQPLVVDIGSGNGLFLFRMARKRKDMNFLGLEINEKLVNHCLDFVQQSGIKNGYFIATNATSTFRSIVSGYPGELVLVSIQCPNPDFNKPEHRWRMVQRSLVEAIADLLTSDGKVFLQSDVEAVAVQMKQHFLQYGKGKLAIHMCNQDGRVSQGEWLKENPFGVRSDWEQHVIDRGAPMYRLMVSKSRISK